MFVVAAGYCAIKRFDPFRFALTMLLTVMKCLEAGTDVLYGLMQKNDELYKSGISLTIKSIGSLLAVLVINLLFQNLLLSFIFDANVIGKYFFTLQKICFYSKI